MGVDILLISMSDPRGSYAAYKKRNITQVAIRSTKPGSRDNFLNEIYVCNLKS